MAGVIIGRFQTPTLHAGHFSLIQEVSMLHEDITILVGVSPAKGTDRDPLDYHTRVLSLKNAADNLGIGKRVSIKPLFDRDTDEEWSVDIDVVTNPEDVLYGSRDSFIPYYRGSRRVQELHACDKTISATQQRHDASLKPEATPSFRKGVIYSCYNRYPISYQAVDIVICDELRPGAVPYQILMGRKPGQDK